MRASAAGAFAAMGAVLAPAACAVPDEAAAQRPAVERPGAACSVTVRFGSYAAGIDRPAAAALEAALRADPRVLSVAVRAWGREGERDLCVVPHASGDAEALIRSARTALPAGELKGWVEILLGKRRVFTTQGSGKS